MNKESASKMVFKLFYLITELSKYEITTIKKVQ